MSRNLDNSRKPWAAAVAVMAITAFTSQQALAEDCIPTAATVGPTHHYVHHSGVGHVGYRHGPVHHHVLSASFVPRGPDCIPAGGSVVSLNDLQALPPPGALYTGPAYAPAVSDHAYDTALLGVPGVVAGGGAAAETPVIYGGGGSVGGIPGPGGFYGGGSGGGSPGGTGGTPSTPSGGGGSPSAVPEPGAWSMMLLGAFLIGGGVRRRRGLTV